MQKEDKGLQMDQMLIVTGPNTMPWREARRKFELLKREVVKIPGVDGVATSAAIPGGGYNWELMSKKRNSTYRLQKRQRSLGRS